MLGSIEKSNELIEKFAEPKIVSPKIINLPEFDAKKAEPSFLTFGTRESFN